MNLKRISLLITSLAVSALPASAQEATLPSEMFGFLGLVEGELVSRADDSFVVKVTGIPRTFQNNRAEDPQVGVGRTLEVRLPVQHEQAIEQYRKTLADLENGEPIEFGARTLDSGQLMVVEMLAGASPERRAEATKGFRGALLGTVVESDPEKGKVVLKIDRVNRVFPNSEARQPFRMVGQTRSIDGFSGRFVDVLIGLSPGDRVEVAAFPGQGDTLRFPGELFRLVRDEGKGNKVKSESPPRDRPREKKGESPPASQAPGKLGPVPEGMHGISGQVSARLIEKDDERGEVVMEIERVTRLWRGNKAANAKSGEGKTVRLTGISGKALDQLLLIDPGDRFSIEVKHVRGDNLVYLGEGLKKLSDDPGDSREKKREENAETNENDPRRFLHGFKGIFVGELVEKDPEKGDFSVKINSIKKTWKQNKAKRAERARGQVWKVRGVTGKWVDVLFEMNPGDKIEVEAFHNSGDKLDFVGEWLRPAEGDDAE